MQNVEVIEIRKIEIKINMTPDQWDPNNKQADTTRWHKSKLLNQRVAKVAPGMSINEFHTDISRFANEIGFGDSGIIIELTEYLYNAPLNWNEVESNGTEASTG